MPRKKVENPKRNKIRTREDFIKETIVDINTNGFKAFTGVHIAETVGKHSSRINELFGGVKEMLKAAIAERDHWEHLLKKYHIPAGTSGVQMKQAFIDMMRENLSAFKGNRDMQHIILGQMTVDHEVLREVSDFREEQGGKMLNMAAPHFEGTDVYFNMFMGFLLYGSYGVVLQSEAIGGTAAGIDLNREEHMREALHMISLLIDLVWRDAGLKRKKAKRKAGLGKKSPYSSQAGINSFSPSGKKQMNPMPDQNR